MPVTEPLRIDVSPTDEGAVVSLTGVLDIASEPALGQEIERLHRAGTRRLRIDLGDLEYIDGLGIGALLRIWRSWEDRGATVELVGPTEPAVQGVFDRMRADDDLPFVDRFGPPGSTGARTAG